MRLRTELEEEVARAICVVERKDPDEDWRYCPQPDGGGVMLDVAVENPARWTTYIRQARAAIAICERNTDK